MHRVLIAASLVAFAAGSVLAQTPPQPGRGAMLAMADANHDGSVSRAEFDAARAARFVRIDANHDGSLQASERAQWGPPPGGAQPANGGATRGDLNGDGVINRAEYDAQAARMFDRMDADRSGAISATEMQAMAERRAQRDSQ